MIVKALEKPIKMGLHVQWIKIEIESKDWSIIFFIITVKGKESEHSGVTKMHKSLPSIYCCDFLFYTDWRFQLFSWCSV